MSQGRVFRNLGATVRLNDGRVKVLHRGDVVPDDAVEGEVERLDEAGALEPAGTPAPETGDAAGPDLAGYDDAEIARWLAGEIEGQDKPPNAGEVVAAAGSDRQLAQRLIDAENRRAGGDPRSTVVTPLQKIVDGD